MRGCWWVLPALVRLRKQQPWPRAARSLEIVNYRITVALHSLQKMSFSQLKTRYVSAHARAHGLVAPIFTKLLTELLTLLAIAAPVLAIVCIGLLHSSLYVITNVSSFFVNTLLAVAALALAACVPYFKSPVHSLLSLIGTFLCAFFMYAVLGAEYLAFVFLIVYVGAIAILFLFVVMLLNVKALRSDAALTADSLRAAAILFGLLLAMYLVRTLDAGYFHLLRALVAQLPLLAPVAVDAIIFAVAAASDVLGFAALFEARAVALFIVVLFILLAAMLGAIIQATKSMEVKSVDAASLEVYAKPLAAIRTSLPSPDRISCVARNSIEGLIIICVIFAVAAAADQYSLHQIYDTALPQCRALADARDEVEELWDYIVSIQPTINAKYPRPEDYRHYAQTFLSARDQYRANPDAPGAAARFVAAVSTIPEDLLDL